MFPIQFVYFFFQNAKEMIIIELCALRSLQHINFKMFAHILCFTTTVYFHAMQVCFVFLLHKTKAKTLPRELTVVVNWHTWPKQRDVGDRILLINFKRVSIHYFENQMKNAFLWFRSLFLVSLFNVYSIENKIDFKQIQTF